MSTYFRRDDWVQDALGNAISGAGVYVCSQPASEGYISKTGSYVPPSPLVQPYKDSAGTIPLTQPVQTDGFGHAYYYTAQGVYTVTYYSPQIGQTTLSNQAIAGAQIYSVAPVGVINGTNTVFTIQVAPANFLMLFLNGVLQVPGGVNYTLSGNTIIFENAPQVDDQLYAVYQ